MSNAVVISLEAADSLYRGIGNTEAAFNELREAIKSAKGSTFQIPLEPPAPMPVTQPVELRDYFIGQALVAVFSRPWHPEMGCDWRMPFDIAITDAIDLADRCMIERDKVK